MTEEEAKTKMCPRLVGNLPLAGVIAKHQFNISGEDFRIYVDALSYCVGTRCMAWSGSAEAGGCGDIIQESTIYTINT